MKRLGAYISPHADTASSSPYFTKGCFVYYENDSNNYITTKIKIWRLDAKFNQQPDEVIFLKSPDDIKNHIEPREAWAKHYISYRNTPYRIQNMKCRFTRSPDIEIIDELTVESIDTHVTWRHDNSSVYQFLKEAKLVDCEIKTNIDYIRKRPIASFNDLVIPRAINDMIEEEMKKSLDRLTLNSIYGRGGFTTNPDPFKVVKIAEKETKTMEKKMKVTDLFLKNINGITITSTYSKLDHDFGDPYYIYYPETEITDDIADTLLTVLLMAKKDFIRKIVFNPEKGTTTINKSFSDPVTVRCKDAKFDYILGYEMARSKMYFGSNDYNWFNKIKNHRKTHIEYTEKPTEPKKTSKKGGKK